MEAVDMHGGRVRAEERLTRELDWTDKILGSMKDGPQKGAVVKNGEDPRHRQGATTSGIEGGPGRVRIGPPEGRLSLHGRHTRPTVLPFHPHSLYPQMWHFTHPSS